MIKANKKDIKRLRELSAELNRGLALLMSNEYQIMKPSNLSSSDIFTASFYPGENYHKITKECGNNLVPMFSAIKGLSELLKTA